MSKDITVMRRDYEGAKLDSIGVGKTGNFHFIFKRGKKYFGIEVNPNNFNTFVYLEKKEKK